MHDPALVDGVLVAPPGHRLRADGAGRRRERLRAGLAGDAGARVPIVPPRRQQDAAEHGAGERHRPESRQDEQPAPSAGSRGGHS